MINLTETEDFESIYWHDSKIMSIEFDIINNNIIFYIDLCICNVENNVSYQPCLVTFYNVSNFKMNLSWEDSCINPQISFIERELIDKPKHFIQDLDYYLYTIHFLNPSIGKIEMPNITQFKLIMLSQPILFQSEEDYYKQRYEAIKNYLNNIKMI